jgi:hypothetical protein
LKIKSKTKCESIVNFVYRALPPKAKFSQLTVELASTIQCLVELEAHGRKRDVQLLNRLMVSYLNQLRIDLNNQDTIVEYKEETDVCTGPN